MATAQYKAFWSVPNAGPCVTTFHFQSSTGVFDALSIPAAVRDFFGRLVSYIPDDVGVSYDTEIGVLDTATGQLTSTLAVATPPVTTGTAAGNWAAGSGARVVWSTADIANGRRVRGATYLVPLSVNAYAGSGRIAGTVVEAITTSATTFLSDIEDSDNFLTVYSRPTPGSPGTNHRVTTGSCSEVVATLRSRKY